MKEIGTQTDECASKFNQFVCPSHSIKSVEFVCPSKAFGTGRRQTDEFAIRFKECVCPSHAIKKYLGV